MLYGASDPGRSHVGGLQWVEDRQIFNAERA